MKIPWGRSWLLVLAAPFLVATGCAASGMDAVSPPAPSTFDKAEVRRGQQLADIGNCAGCHSTTSGRPYAGGLPIGTPFGTIYSTNITPDPHTGIGTWSKAAFVRAMREGIGRDGSRLYPAFPYDHFTRLSDGDLDALYAFVMTRDPVQADNRKNDLHFPFNIRPLLAAWNVLFLDKTQRPADAAQTAEWNRGAYLVDALGHCASCHSPRNALGAEDTKQRFSGGMVDGWVAPALNDKSPSPTPWTVDSLTRYLQTGLADGHAIAAGPMQGVVHALNQVDEGDVRAIATYVVGSMGGRAVAAGASTDADRLARSGPLVAERPASAISAPGSDVDRQRLALGATVYQDTCASCHDLGRQASSNSGLQMPLAVALHEPDPGSLIRIVKDGIAPVPGERGRIMPDFGGSLSDAQIAALAAYLRQAAAPDAPPWTDLDRHVKEAREP